MNSKARRIVVLLIVCALFFYGCGSPQNAGDAFMQSYFENVKKSDYPAALNCYHEEFYKLLGKDSVQKILSSTYQKLGKLESAKLVGFLEHEQNGAGREGVYYILHYDLDYVNEEAVRETFNVLASKADGKTYILNRRIENSRLIPEDPFMLKPFQQ